MLDGHREADIADEAVDELRARRQLGEHDLERPHVAGDAVLGPVDRAHAAVADERTGSSNAPRSVPGARRTPVEALRKVMDKSEFQSRGSRAANRTAVHRCLRVSPYTSAGRSRNIRASVPRTRPRPALDPALDPALGPVHARDLSHARRGLEHLARFGKQVGWIRDKVASVGRQVQPIEDEVGIAELEVGTDELEVGIAELEIGTDELEVGTA